MDLKELGLTEEQILAVQKVLQSEGDKVRTEYTKKIKGLEDELIQYKPKEKSQSEIDFENRLKAIEEREAKLQEQEKISTISNKLNEQGLPSQLSKYLLGVEDVETEINSLNEVLKDFKVNNAYQPSNAGGGAKVITKEDFTKMGYTERLNLFETNPELFKTLSE